MPSSTLAAIDEQEISSLLGPEGPLALHLKGFEVREEQRAMAKAVAKAFNGEQIALIEAGTGTGKSLGYLLPAILWALKTGERTVISTNTINLQEQLLQKDIPLLTAALNVPIKAVLVKGTSNYVCRRRLADAVAEPPDLFSQESQELQEIEAWAQVARAGSKSDLPTMPSPKNWEKISVEADACPHGQCPFYEGCFLFKARQDAQDAKILIVNHHLLFADLALRADTDNFDAPCVLPPFTRLILDEAHNIEDIATAYFAKDIGQSQFTRFLGRLLSEQASKPAGLLPHLRQRLLKCYREELDGEMRALEQRLQLDYPGQSRAISTQARLFFQTLNKFTALLSTAKSGEGQEGESKLRLRKEHLDHPYWLQQVRPGAAELVTALHRFAQSLEALKRDLTEGGDELLREEMKSPCVDLVAIKGRLEMLAQELDFLVKENQHEMEHVRWIERRALKHIQDTHLMDADLNIASVLTDYLFNRYPTTILCSATLTTNDRFDFMRERLGLTEEYLQHKVVTEQVYPSPFDYSRQALLAIPTDLPMPTSPQFDEATVDAVYRCLEASRGNAFVLFTSYGALNRCHALLKIRLAGSKLHLMKQGEDHRQKLLQRFKQQEGSVLLATDSFWEGVDVAGDALRLVILVKLPFQVPSEPIVQARSELIESTGKSAFMEYSVPSAIVKFKQGFGRLIRHRQDRGCIVCLDRRILDKPYGRLFLNSLPPCARLQAPVQQLTREMRAFYWNPR